MISVVFATASAPVTLRTGQTVRVHKGQHWPAEDPVVQAAGPGLFSTDPRWGMVYTREPDGYDAPIDTETATAAPGERRATRRPAAA